MWPDMCGNLSPSVWRPVASVFRLDGISLAAFSGCIVHKVLSDEKAHPLPQTITQRLSLDPFEVIPDICGEHPADSRGVRGICRSRLPYIRSRLLGGVGMMGPTGRGGVTMGQGH